MYGIRARTVIDSSAVATSMHPLDVQEYIPSAQSLLNLIIFFYKIITNYELNYGSGSAFHQTPFFSLDVAFSITTNKEIHMKKVRNEMVFSMEEIKMTQVGTCNNGEQSYEDLGAGGGGGGGGWI